GGCGGGGGGGGGRGRRGAGRGGGGPPPAVTALRAFERLTTARGGGTRGTMAAVPPQQSIAVRLVLGDEELLAARAVSDAIAAARDADPDAEVREYTASELVPGELAEMTSPSLFGGRRVLVVRGGQDAKKDLAATLIEYARSPDPDVTLVVTHLGSAKGKALADGLRNAGAVVVPVARITRHRERVDLVRNEVRRLGGKCAEDAAEALIAAVGNDLRELVAACSQLVADT